MHKRKVSINIKDKLLSLRYRTKLILVFFLLIVITAGILGSITYYNFATSSKNKTIDYQYQLAEQINRNIDRYIKEMQIISLSPLYDVEILNILKNHQRTISKPSLPLSSEKAKLSSYISSLAQMRSEVRGIHLIANDGTIFSNLDYSSVKLKMLPSENNWQRKIKQGDGKWVLIPLHNPEYYIHPKEAVFSIGRLIREPKTNKPLGIIKVDIKQELLTDIITKQALDSSIFVLTEENEFIFYSENDLLFTNKMISNIENGYSEKSINQDKYLTVYNQSSYSGTKIIMLTPFEKIFSEVNDLRRVLFIVVVACIAVSVLLGFVLSKPLVSSIHTLQRAMKQVRNGDFSRRVTISSNDEIGHLGEGFNRMIDEIDRLVSEVYETEIREKEAKIRVLQGQMNPHFLYNTLESINMLSIAKGNLEVSDMVSSLGKLMRYTIDHHSKNVTLKEELDFIRSYINIQQTRLGEKLKYMEDIDSTLLDYLIPKLLLQPLVENSIIHGIQHREGFIKVHIFKGERDLQIIISDNGRGANEDLIQTIQQSLKDASLPIDSKGIALSNVNERIKMMYGKQYGLIVSSWMDEGFIAKINLPL